MQLGAPSIGPFTTKAEHGIIAVFQLTVTFSGGRGGHSVSKRLGVVWEEADDVAITR